MLKKLETHVGWDASKEKKKIHCGDLIVEALIFT